MHVQQAIAAATTATCNPPVEWHLPGEEWREVAGLSGRYMVSNLGRVWSVPRRSPHRAPRCPAVLVRGRMLRPSTDRAGYLQVSVCRDGASIKAFVHRLVAEAFVEKPDQDGKVLVVNHVDHDKKNNAASNLEWVTRSQNMKAANVFYGGLSGAAAVERRRSAGIARWIDRGRHLARGRADLSAAVEQVAAIVSGEPRQKSLFSNQEPTR